MLKGELQVLEELECLGESVASGAKAEGRRGWADPRHRDLKEGEPRSCVLCKGWGTGTPREMGRVRSNPKAIVWGGGLPAVCKGARGQEVAARGEGLGHKCLHGHKKARILEETFGAALVSDIHTHKWKGEYSGLCCHCWNQAKAFCLLGALKHKWDGPGRGKERLAGLFSTRSTLLNDSV